MKFEIEFADRLLRLDADDRGAVVALTDASGVAVASFTPDHMRELLRFLESTYPAAQAPGGEG